MPRDIEWKLVVDETGAVKRMEIVGKEAEKTDKSLKKTKDEARGLGNELKKLGSSFGGLAGMVGGGLGLAGLGFGIESIVSKTSEMAHETERFSAISGISARNSLYYVAALKSRGVSSEQFGRGLAILSKSIQTAERQQYQFTVGQDKAAAKGHAYTGLIGVQAEAFAALGLNVAQLSHMNPEKRLETVLTALTKMRDPLVKARVESQLFGRSGVKLAPVLEQNALNIAKQRQEAERFFPSLKGGKNVMQEMIEKQAESKLAWEGLQFTIGTEVAPALNTAMGAFSGLISEVEHGKGPIGEIKSLFSDVAKGIKKVDEILGIGKGGKHGNTSGLSDIQTLIAGYAGIKLGRKGLKSLGKAAGKSVLDKLIGGGESAAEGGAGAALASRGIGLARALGPYGLAAGAIYGGVKIEEHLIGGKVTELLGGNQPGESGKEGEASLLAMRARAATRGEVKLARGAHIPKDAQLRQALLQLIETLHQQGQPGDKIVGELHLDSIKVGEIVALNPRAMRFLAEGIERSSLSRSARAK